MCDESSPTYKLVQATLVDEFGAARFADHLCCTYLLQHASLESAMVTFYKLFFSPLNLQLKMNEIAFFENVHTALPLKDAVDTVFDREQVACTCKMVRSDAFSLSVAALNSSPLWHSCTQNETIDQVLLRDRLPFLRAVHMSIIKYALQNVRDQSVRRHYGWSLQRVFVSSVNAALYTHTDPAAQLKIELLRRFANALSDDTEKECLLLDTHRLNMMWMSIKSDE